MGIKDCKPDASRLSEGFLTLDLFLLHPLPYSTFDAADRQNLLSVRGGGANGPH